MTEKPRKKYDIKQYSNFGKFDSKPFKRKRREPDPPGLAVAVDGDDVMKAYRRLKKKILKDGLMDEIKERRYYQKPSEKKQIKLKEQRRNMMKAQRERAMEYGIRFKNYDPNTARTRGY